MKLAIDIGNSNTHLAVFAGSKPVFVLSFSNGSPKNYRKTLRNAFERTRGNITSVGISSVVPKLTSICIKESRNKFKLTPLTINNKTELPVTIKIKNPGSIGADRLCNAAFGFEYYKEKENVIIADFGTANTYDIVLRNGDFIGGIIAPGIMTSSKALSLSTGKLPLIDYKEMKFNNSVIGKYTKKAILSGLINYPLFATDGIVSSIEKELKRKFRVILTGGAAKPFVSRLSHPAIYIENTVLHGINIILNNYSSK
ncbi:MAG: type III pantothenate kinase [Ignavibacteria bacterium]|nr:type III pantothenate kinase [Ignavibacteria bacterium]